MEEIIYMKEVFSMCKSLRRSDINDIVAVKNMRLAHEKNGFDVTNLGLYESALAYLRALEERETLAKFTIGDEK